LALAADQFQRAMADLARRLAPLLEALREWMQSPEMGRFMQGLAAMGEVMECAPSYCAPYDRELARLGLPPLTKDEQRDFILIAVLLGGRQAQQLGQRVPLVEVALAAERHDIAAAVVMERKLTQDVIHQLERDNSRPEGDLLADAYLELRESILPSIRRRIGRIPMRDTRRIARPLLKQVARDAYLLKAIRRAVVRRLERETQGMEGAPWDEEARHKLAQLKHRLAGDDSELNWDVERALASFLARPRVSELDRKLVQELRQSPESSARQIALCIGESVRTVQHHRRTLVDYVRKQLNT
jgi:DNA-binding CsgD family transcriptional regulator